MNLIDDGIEIRRKLVSDSSIERIKREVDSYSEEYPGHGIRNANKKFTSIDSLSKSSDLMGLVRSILGAEPQVVRVIFFDKTPEKNWLVTWHQDKTVAVSQKFSLPEWGPWSIKDQSHHAQPPLHVLDRMVTVRVHLDDSDKNNGCLKAIPGSHQLGFLSQEEIANIVASKEAAICEVESGDAVVMRPHILHSSSKSTIPRHRRVVHIEYSDYVLPEGSSWA